MKSKAHILVVEDKSLIYKRIKMALKDAHYDVGDYAPSVSDAIKLINKKRPDLVLLDIDLQGEHTGIDLGKLLSTEYHIPFIYVTDLGDDQTFYEGLQTKHDNFIIKKYFEEETIVNTKPHLDTKEIIRAIQTTLSQNKKASNPIIKESIVGYVDYIQKTRDLGSDDITEVSIPYNEIVLFTTNSTKIDKEKTIVKGKDIYKKLERNNARFCTWDKKSYITPNNLSTIYGVLPHYFARISEDYIVNISHDMLDGRINGKRIKIRDKIYTISDTYKAEVKKRYEAFCQNFK